MKNKEKFFKNTLYVISYLGNKISTWPVLTSFAFLSFFFVVISIVKSYFFPTAEGFAIGLLVESYGILVEIFLISFLILWINKKGKNNKENQHYQMDLYDFERMENEGAIFHKTINIRRLNRNGISNIDLKNNTLNNTDLQGVYLCGANVTNCNFQNSNLKNSFFIDANLQSANLTGADISNAD